MTAEITDARRPAGAHWRALDPGTVIDPYGPGKLPYSGFNDPGERVARQLPVGYASPSCETLGQELARFRCASRQELADIVEGDGRSLKERLAAGILLSVLGDIRISVFDPTMIDIPASKVRIGLEPGDIDAVAAGYQHLGIKRIWIEKECPCFDVDIEKFRISKYPVTQQEYEAFLASTGYPEIPTSWLYGRYHPATANHPVYSISPAAADRYARWLSERTGRSFRLPTEYEWEFAAAGFDKNHFPWGMSFEGDRANTIETKIYATTPVGMFPAGKSSFGALDMAGNVEEYVATNYAPYPGARVVEDDLFEALGSCYRVARGGAFNVFQDMARCTRRHGGPHPKLYYAMGFRLAEG
jgi:formylglycine-generating enzyme required for sulfatase activity